MLAIFQFFLNSMHAGYFFHHFLSSADIFQNELFQKISSGIFKKLFQEHYKSVKRFGSAVLSGLIWVQTILQRFSADDFLTHSLPNLVGWLIQIEEIMEFIQY